MHRFTVRVKTLDGRTVADSVRAQLKALHPTTDNIGDVIVTIGSGAPHRLIVAAMDEPGFVVSEITADGYLRVQRLPQGGMPAMFNELASAQPVKITKPIRKSRRRP